MILIGFLLGFFGYVFLGTINLTVVQLTLDESKEKVWGYIMFVAFMEFVYCVGCMAGMNVLLSQPSWILITKCVAVIIFLTLGVYTFFQAIGEGKQASNANLAKGIFVAIVNPLQIPFWMIWGVYAIENKWVQTDMLSLVIFGIITTAGTICILWLYAIGGKKLVEKLKLNRKFLNRFIGILFIVLAVFQTAELIRMYTSPS